MEFWKIKNISDTEVEIKLYGEIVDSEPWWSYDELYITPTSFLREMEKLKNAKEITIRLHSGGGDVFVALGIYNQLKSLSAKKTVYIDGLCASAATIIACAGDVVKIPTSALYMIHDPTVTAYASFGIEDLDRVKNMLEKCKLSIIEVYKTKVSLTDNEISKMMNEETWLLGEETLLHGFADEVLTQKVSFQNNGKFLIANNLYTDLSKFKNIPKDIELVENLTLPSVEDKLIEEPQNEESEVIMNLEELKNKYPDLVNQIKNEGITEGKEEGVKEERTRLQDLHKIRNRVDKKLLDKAMFDEPMDAKTLAFESMQVDDKRGQKFLNDLDDDLDGSGVNEVEVSTGTPSNDEGAIGKAEDVNDMVTFMNADKRRVK